MEQDVHILIDRYLQGKLGEQEILAFEERLRSDNDFAKTFDAQQIVHEMVIDNELLLLKAQIGRDLGNGSNAPSGNPSSAWKYFASAAIMISAAIILYFAFKEKPLQGDIQKEITITENFGDKPEVIHADTTSFNSLSNDSGQIIENNTPRPIEIFTTCADTTISFSCQAMGACAEKTDGAIEIDINTIKSGKAPYKFAVNRNGNFGLSPVISNLKPGRYDLFVKDSQDCLRKLNAKVEVPDLGCGQ